MSVNHGKKNLNDSNVYESYKNVKMLKSKFAYTVRLETCGLLNCFLMYCPIDLGHFLKLLENILFPEK